jgi:diamine N-acetyltransferase
VTQRNQDNVSVQLVPITKENWETAAKLEVREDQARFVASNVWTIAETRFFPWTELRGIVAAGEMVGFLAYGKDPADGEYWLYRFMIDRRHQGKGYGRAGLLALIDELRRNPEFKRLTVGYEPDNVPAERLYLSAGFVKGEPAPWGESTARLTLAG